MNFSKHFETEKKMHYIIPRKFVLPLGFQIKSLGFESICLLFYGFSNHFPETIGNRQTQISCSQTIRFDNLSPRNRRKNHINPFFKFLQIEVERKILPEYCRFPEKLLFVTFYLIDRFICSTSASDNSEITQSFHWKQFTCENLFYLGKK